MSSVSVLAPNGRRQTVKCNPNTTLMQILEEVCRKQGFKSEEYDLKHHNKVLDTTISFRFSGLPNNAQLELVTATRTRIDSEIILAVNLENGNRIVGNFLPDEIIWNVLSSTCPNEVDINKNPVVIYMRQEIYGDKLQTTTLRSLGLTGGRAMIRLLHKSPDELKQQAHVSAPIPVKVAEEKPYHRVLKTIEPFPLQETPKTTPTHQTEKKQVDVLKLAREQIKSNVEAKTTESVLELSKKIDEKEEVMDVDDQELPMSTSFNATDCLSSSETQYEDEFIFVGERNAMLFSLETAESLPPEDIPDGFFELNITDAKRILSDIRRKQRDTENSPLMTAAMRKLEEAKHQLKQLNRYKQAIIRVLFPDRTILQGTFRPTETIQDVCDFTRKYLEEPKFRFYLYTAPPKDILPEESKLIEIGCVPGALLHLGSDDTKNLLLKSEFRNKLTTNSVASLAASKIRKENTRPVPDSEDTEEEVMEVTHENDTPGPSSEATTYERRYPKSSEKIPKWFKTGK